MYLLIMKIILSLKTLILIYLKKDFVGISGQSGVGKTTLLSLIMGLLHPTEGKIYFNGKEKKNNGIKIGYVGQTHNLIEGSIAENIAFGINHKKINFDKIQKLTSSLGLNEFINDLPIKLIQLFLKNHLIYQWDRLRE